ncbi:hypothetical protein, partial [Klebsiella aerogenes]|uniref:hypothetical protein n=1 Tax=Klebsiella aerogenes TaxID=548 RepID=UPI001A939724
MLTNQAAGPGIFPQAVQAGERSAAPVSAAPPGEIYPAQQKTPHLPVRGSSYLMPGSSLLSHGETPHYHRRYGVSL